MTARILKLGGLFLLTLGLVLGPGAASFCPARTLYVAPNGADVNPGSEKSPWLTLQHAVDSALPGDVILVQSGTYAGFRVRGSGEPDAWITLKAAPNARVVINRPGPRNPHKSNIEFETWEGEGIVAYWVVQGLEISDAPRYGIDVRGNAKKASHHITVRQNLVHDCRLSGIFFAFVDHPLVENNQSHHNGEHGIYVSNSGDLPKVKTNTLSYNAACGLQINADHTQGGDGIITKAVVRGNTIHTNGARGGAGINLDGVVDGLIAGNTLVRNRAGGIALYQANGAVASRDCRLERNIIRMPEGSRWAVNLAHPDCTGVSILRNQIRSKSAVSGSIQIPTPRLAGFKSDYNKLTPRFSTDGGKTVVSLERWRSFGHDLHSTVAAEPPKP